MKIALLTPGGVDRSGTERVIPCILWLIEELAAAGHEVHVFAAHQEPLPGRWPLCGATVHNAGAGAWRWRMFRALRAEHRRERVDVIHALWAAMGEFGALPSRLLRIPMIVTLAGGEPVDLRDIGYGGLATWRGRMQLRIAAAAARRVTVPSIFMRDLAAGLGIETVTIPLGVSLRHWPATAPRLRDPAAPLRLLHVASLNRVKDQRALLQAMVLLKREGAAFDLRIAGFDTLNGEIQRLATALGLDDCVQFLGELGRAELRAAFEQADVLVMTSRHEAGPLVLLEAALAGVPTVGTAVGHIADLSPDAAIAVPVGDSAALAQALRAPAADEPRRLAVARTAQAFALRHDAAFTAGAFLDLYRSAIGG